MAFGRPVREAPDFFARETRWRKARRGRAGQYVAGARIHKLLTRIENRFESRSARASVGDYIRLLQLERELEENEGPRVATVAGIARSNERRLSRLL